MALCRFFRDTSENLVQNTEHKLHVSAERKEGLLAELQLQQGGAERTRTYAHGSELRSKVSPAF